MATTCDLCGALRDVGAGRCYLLTDTGEIRTAYACKQCIGGAVPIIAPSSRDDVGDVLRGLASRFEQAAAAAGRELGEVDSIEHGATIAGRRDAFAQAAAITLAWADTPRERHAQKRHDR